MPSETKIPDGVQKASQKQRNERQINETPSNQTKDNIVDIEQWETVPGSSASQAKPKAKQKNITPNKPMIIEPSNRFSILDDNEDDKSYEQSISTESGSSSEDEVFEQTSNDVEYNEVVKEC